MARKPKPTPIAFSAALAEVLRHEGGYVDHPSDPGGATNLGITINTLRDWRGGEVSKADVEALTEEEAAKIYRALYWDRIGGDDLPPALAFMVFDAAVNHGPGRAAQFLQRAVGAKPDGAVGPKTIAAAQAADPLAALIEVAAERMLFYAGLRHFAQFGRGWSRRLMNVTARAARMAEGA